MSTEVQHWLRDYEGPRGVAYLVGLVGAIAPSMIALFWLDPTLFAKLDWLRSLLLCASIGGFSTVLAVVFTTPFLAESGKRPAPVEEVRRASRFGLAFGSAMAFMGQALALSYCTRLGQSFKTYVSGAIWLTLLITVGVILLLHYSETWGSQRKAKNAQSQ
jgi:hypothetical protein